MQALTVEQPAALLLAAGVQTFWTRAWNTTRRGPYLLYCAPQWDDLLAAKCELAVRHMDQWGVRVPGLWPPWHRCCGHVLACVQLVDCRRMVQPPPGLEGALSTYGPGRYALCFDEIEPFCPPIPWRGAAKFWQAPRGLRRLVRAQLGSDEAPLHPLWKDA